MEHAARPSGPVRSPQMDPTTAIPVHFTLQALSIAAAGLLLAWSLVRKRWIGALGAALLAVGEGLHAGRFLVTDDEPALLVVRFVGILFLSIAAVRAPGRLLYGLGAAAVVAGAAWGSVAGGGIADPAGGPHACFALGAVLLAVWAWRVSRDSVRLRVLTALVAMLAITVVMGGGAVSRVAAIDKRNEQLRQLGSAATAASSDIAQSMTGLARRAALLSPLLGDDLEQPGEPAAVRTSQPGDAESIAVVDERGVRAFVSGRGNTPPAYGPEKVLASPAVQRALAGEAATGLDVSGGRLAILAAAPIFRPGGPGAVIGAVAIVRSRSPEALREAARAYAPEAEIVVVGGAAAASERALLGIQPGTLDGEDVVFDRVSTADDTRPAATIGIGGDDLRMVVVGSDEGIVQAATGLLRALLVAILAAALLAVIVALWLSARVTRPILDLAAGAEQVKADFLASVSHELRTPLTPIRGYTELLRRGRVPAGRRADYLDEIGEAAGRLERIVTLMLDVAALEAGRFQVGDDDVDPNELLAEAAERWRQRGGRHPFRVAAPQSLPRVRGDADALGRVLDELIDNAVKFSPDGGAVELRARRSKTGVEISVADEGIGISTEQAGELTNAFAQVESGDRRRFGGLGLGLTYVSGVLNAHGSGLAFSTEPGGTAFSFALPTAGMVSRMPARATRSSSSQRPKTRS